MKKKTMQRILALVVLAVLCLTLLPGRVTAAGGRGWKQIVSKSVYYDNNGALVKGFLDYNGTRYYMDQDGYMKTGWIYYYYDQNYYNVGLWYYADENGVLQKGWQQYYGDWYYFRKPADIDSYEPDVFKYSMQTQGGWGEGCFTQLNGNFYIFDKDGVMRTGWYTYKDTASSDPEEVLIYRYYMDPDGTVVEKGWRQVDGKWYYLQGYECCKGWKAIGDKTYYFKENGEMAANEYCNGYWLNPNGTFTYYPVASWHHNSNGDWYGDPTGWYARNVTLKIDGKYYTFDSRGYVVK